MNEIETLEVKDLLSQQTNALNAELEAIKERLPEPWPRWWVVVVDIVLTVVAFVGTFFGGVLFHRYLYYFPGN
jgi:hypothetical protein